MTSGRSQADHSRPAWPGCTSPSSPARRRSLFDARTAMTIVDKRDDEIAAEAVELQQEFAGLGIGAVLDQLDSELIGFRPVKTQIRQVASLAPSERLRKRMGWSF